MSKLRKRLVFLFAFAYVTVYSQTSISQSDIRRFEIAQDAKVTYRLFPTSNNWNFLKLDTRTGQIWGLQYYVGKEVWSKNVITYNIDDYPIEEAEEKNIGRFTLYPTSNMWNFILLDQFDGRTWQVQYSIQSEDECFRRRIY